MQMPKNKKFKSPRIYSVKSTQFIWTDAGGTGEYNQSPNQYIEPLEE